MTYSYSKNPKDSLLDEIRFMIGDTDSMNPFLQDEEINFALKKFDSEIYQTAIFLCRRILIAASKLSDSISGMEQVRGSQIQAQFKQRISDLERERLEAESLGICAGGLSIPRKFTDKQGDNPRALGRSLCEL
jgi:hypothetical protein